MTGRPEDDFVSGIDEPARYNELVRQRARQMTEGVKYDWQPMATAPKDQRLLIAEGEGRWLAFWAKFYSPFYRGEVEGWWTSSDPSQAHVVLPQDAIGWMHVP